jgi:SAM-dependent methyltransferase
MSSSDAGRNRAYWDRTSDDYQDRHAELIGRSEPRWGVWQLPEAELDVLGDVAGKDVLELGCGAAQWSILLAQWGARVVGLDNSPRQLEHARAALTAAGLEFPLVHAGTEDVPLPDASFDVEVDELIEVRPPQGTESTYRTPAETEWARSWPLEEIWKVRKAR